MKSFILVLLALFSGVEAKIIPTNQISDIERHIDAETLIFFNLTEVILDTPMMLGSQGWRKYVRQRVEASIHDALTLYIAKRVPYRLPEIETQKLIRKLQKNKAYVFALTARGRHEWYSTQVEGIDRLTESFLAQVGVDFSLSPLPSIWQDIDTQFGNYFLHGIFYTTNSLDKGEFLTSLLLAGEEVAIPKFKVLLVDDKLPSLEEVESALKRLEVPFTGFHYTRTQQLHPYFDPAIANIQLECLLVMNTLLTDEEALIFGLSYYPDLEPESYFKSLIELFGATPPIFASCR